MPKVSVIIPNYNHSLFLRRRIQSVLDQTYQDFELIFLDDGSTDNSIEIFQQFRFTCPLKSFFNPVNSGNTFHQWNQGLKLATGDYIWIAESDDYADPEFLNQLVTVLDQDPDAGLAYSHSWAVTPDGKQQRFPYYDDFHPERWQSSFRNDGIAECQRYLCFRNTIPNASAVLFRRNLAEEIGGADESFVLCGDWFMWVNLLSLSDIAFISVPLNYFRQHAESARSRRILIERLRVIDHLILRFGLSDRIIEEVFDKFTDDWCWSLFYHHFPDDMHFELADLADKLYPELKQYFLRQVRRRAGAVHEYVKELEQAKDQLWAENRRLTRELESKRFWKFKLS